MTTPAPSSSVDATTTATTTTTTTTTKRPNLPVTLLSGFLGAGKTTLLRHLLMENNKSDTPLRIALIVNDMSALNIDAMMVRSLTQVEEKLVEMQNGCICCTLREDLLVELKKLALEGRFDYVIIESTGISEPQQVAETFAFEDEEHVALNEWTRLDTLVTVVDCANFSDFIDTTKTVRDTKEAVGEQDARPLSQLMVEQIEFANVILLNKCDLVDEETVNNVESRISVLNPEARVIRTTKSSVELSRVLNTNAFDLEAATYSAGWMKVLRGEPMTPESEEYGVTSFIYERRRPFHPGRLYHMLSGENPLPNVIRSKGLAWLVNHEIQAIWASTGKMYGVSPGGPWYASLPRELFERDPNHQDLLTLFEGPHGDRRIELAIIGHNMDRAAVEAKLDECLMGKDELWDPTCDVDPFQRIMLLPFLEMMTPEMREKMGLV